MGFEAFVREHLPPPPAQVLEVGCGDGALARSLAAEGHRVTAIDPRAPEGEIFRAVTLADFDEPGPFDAVVAGRSLHHIHDLPAAVERLARLLPTGGLLIVDEHAFDRMDEPTARWFAERGGAVEHWREGHAGLHGYDAMKRELDRHFAERRLDWGPYLYGELGGDAGDFERERALIEAGEIRAMGFRYVGARA
jgi:SAM-dependent methyltransferase